MLHNTVVSLIHDTLSSPVPDNIVSLVSDFAVCAVPDTVVSPVPDTVILGGDYRRCLHGGVWPAYQEWSKPCKRNSKDVSQYSAGCQNI